MGIAQNILRKRWYQISMGLLSLSVLAINLMMLRTSLKDIKDDAELGVDVLSIDYAAIRPVGVLLFLVLALIYLIQCIVFRKVSWLLFIKSLIYVLFSIGAAMLLFLSGEREEIWPFACFLYIVAVLIGCVISVIYERSKWHVLLLVLTLVVAAYLGLVILATGIVDTEEAAGISSMSSILAILVAFIMIDVQRVASIVPLAFSSVRMDVLKRIIKKTYAAEILIGILLLIVAISLILPAFEPGINNFGDALWYCFAIVTTIGFGDIYATSAMGRILSVVLGLYGIIVVSLITSIIVNFYGEMKKEEDAGGGDSGGKDRVETNDGEAAHGEAVRGEAAHGEAVHGEAAHGEAAHGETDPARIRERKRRGTIEEIEI